MVTFKRGENLPPLSIISGDLSWHGAPIEAKPTPLGMVFLMALEEFLLRNPPIQAGQKVIMPDHVHIVFWVKEYLQRDFMWYMGMLKTRCTQIMRQRCQYDESHSYFVKKDQNHRILLKEGQWQRWNDYILDNPRRALMRATYPDLFRRSLLLTGEKDYYLYGNLFLLKYPDKCVVRYSSKLTAEQNEANLRRCSLEASMGAVLVSPFIHKEEKALFKEGLKQGWKMIKIIRDPYAERTHPHKEDFNYCATGHLLLFSYGNDVAAKRDAAISRHVCMGMNALAEKVAMSDFCDMRLRRL